MKCLEETVHVRFAQEVELLRRRDGSDGNDAWRNQECPDKPTIQSSSRPENLAPAQEATSWTHLFKGQISEQWVKRQRDHIGNKATKKNDALNWATTVIEHFLTRWFKVWDQRHLDCHGHDCQGRANKLKDVAFREIAHLCTFEEAVPEEIRWLFQTPLEECLHWPLFRQRAWISNWENIIKKECAAQMETW